MLFSQRILEVVIQKPKKQRRNDMKSLQALINKHGDQEISEEKFIETFGIEVKKRWKPDGGLYWYVDSDGVVCYTYWSNRLGDRRRWLLGNVYENRRRSRVR